MKTSSGRSLRVAVGTMLLGLGGCTPSADTAKTPTKKAPIERTNVSSEEPPTPPPPRDIDVNPGPHDRDPVPTPQPKPEPKPEPVVAPTPEPKPVPTDKHTNTGPKKPVDP